MLSVTVVKIVVNRITVIRSTDIWRRTQALLLKAYKSFLRPISSDARMERAASTMAGSVMEMLTAVTRVMSILTFAPMKLFSIY